MAGFVPDSWGLGNITEWTRPRSNTLLGLGAGFLSGDLGNVGRYAMEGQQLDNAYATQQKEEAQRQEQLNQTIEWLRQGGNDDLIPLVSAGQANIALQEAVRRSQPIGSGEPFTLGPGQTRFSADGSIWAQGPADNGADSGVEYGLTPQWFQMADGSYGFGVLGKDGSFKPVQTPEGATMLDPRSIATERAYGTKIGGAQGEAAAAAPGDIASAQSALDIINQIRTSPELGWATGTSAGFGGNSIPGTGRFGFQNLVDQAKSGAFLTAVQEMRGLERAQARIATNQPQQPNGNQTSTGVTWSYTP